MNKAFAILFSIVLAGPVSSFAGPIDPITPDPTGFLDKKEGSFTTKITESPFYKAGPLTIKISADKKKKRPRGVEPARYFFPDYLPLLFLLAEKELCVSYGTFYVSHLFFSNEKRGPPSFVVS